VLRAYKTELDPTVEQRRALARHVAGARVAHNWVLERWHVLAGLPRLVAFLRVLDGVSADQQRAAEEAWRLGFLLRALVHGERRATRRPKRTKKNGVLEYSEKVVFAVEAPVGPILDQAPNSDWIHSQLTAEKRTVSNVAWLAELSAYAVREGAADVGRGYQAYFRRLKKHRVGNHSECKPRRGGKGCQLGEPQFRSARARQYHVDQPNAIRVTVRSIRIPGVGDVRLKEHDYLPVTRDNSHHFVRGGKVCGLGISERAGRWKAALRVDVPSPIPQRRGPGRVLRERAVPRVPGRRVGVENGVRVLVSAYDGDSSETFVDVGLRDDDRILRFLRMRRLWERRMARRWRDGISRRDQSAGWKEAVQRVRHYHARIVDLRDDRCGKAVRRIVDSGAEAALLREPHVADLLNRTTAPDARTRNRLAPDVHGARMGDVRRRLEYKMAWAGGRMERVDRFEPVTKRCSACGVVRTTSPSYPNFKCASCGHIEDRDDANAPKNLFGYNSSGGSSSGEAGPRSAGSKALERAPNGREKRSARVGGQLSATAPYRSGNRARPGASVSDGPNDLNSHPESEIEQSCARVVGSEQFRSDTALPLADEADLSQTNVQVRDMSSLVTDAWRSR